MSDTAARPLCRSSAVADLRQVGAIAGDERGAVAGRAVTGHDDGGLERLESVEARQPVLKARAGARKGGLIAHGDIAGKQDALGLDPDDRIADRVVGADRKSTRLNSSHLG